MRKEIARLLSGAMLLVWSAMPVFADALLRAWAQSGNGVPVKLLVETPRGGFPSGAIQTVHFSLWNPLPRRTVRLQATASYLCKAGQGRTSQSNAVELEVDQSARNCRIYLYIINGYALEDTLYINGEEWNLPYNTSFLVILVPELPASAVLQGRVNIFAK